ncbi:hypothetical protein PR048_003122, partial [Dryococelus australis]
MATLRYLATGRTHEDLKFSCRFAPQTSEKIIPDTCEVIFKALRNYCKCPTTEKESENVAGECEHRWNFPNCIRAVDGKHVAITPPPRSESYFYHYKNFHSQVLLGIANTNYELLYSSFGINGRVSDGGLRLVEKTRRRESEFTKGGNVRYVLVVDDVFPLREYIMKPFSHKVATPARKIFNCRVFGIIVERFGVLQKPLSLINYTKVHHIVMAFCTLHNFLRSNIQHQYTHSNVWMRSSKVVMLRLGLTATNLCLSKTACQPTNSEELVRESFVRYFNNEGQVSLATK